MIRTKAIGTNPGSNNLKNIKSTPLHDAARLGHKETVSQLLDSGEDIEAKDERECTPIHLAALKHVAIVSLLLERGADIEARSRYGCTPLHFAARSGDLEIVSLLLKAGADIEARIKTVDETPLHCAARVGRTDVVSLLIQKGADLKATNWVAPDGPSKVLLQEVQA